jgi:hypothetical protein
MNVNVSACSCPCACPWDTSIVNSTVNTITMEELRNILRRQNEFSAAHLTWIDIALFFLLAIVFWEAVSFCVVLVSVLMVLIECIATFLYKHRGVIYILGTYLVIVIFWVQVFREYHTLTAHGNLNVVENAM